MAALINGKANSSGNSAMHGNSNLNGNSIMNGDSDMGGIAALNLLNIETTAGVSY